MGCQSWYAVYAGLFTLAPVLSSLALSVYLLHLANRFRRSEQGGKWSGRQRLRWTVFIFVTTLWTAAALVPARSYFLFNAGQSYTLGSPSPYPSPSPSLPPSLRELPG